ncbi:hypothetical protein F8568_035395 [Actinomadura sp. LD22]|uniref:Uncharacterized protein n=1 Tax=Actinomadura physcomitrii TaxID=2650748 RepID=A0A6I4MS51_9ACTN|nr:hypothetical protein [Actinomadura physcomitrii]MWA05559.1 hypothetical protein [Actinomadura physcomitrii]
MTLEWARSCPDLSAAEQAFLDAAVQARDREIEEAEQRRKAETEARIERERAEDRHRADQAELARVQAERAAKQIVALALSPDQRRLATSARDGSTWVWDLRRRTPLLSLTDPIPGQEINGVAFVDEMHLVTATNYAVRFIG